MNVVISGTSSGLGLELAKCFLSSGNTVIGFSRSRSSLSRSKYYRHFSVDISDRNSVAATIADCGIERLDLLINNAGQSGSGQKISEVDPTEVQDLLDVNLFGSLNLVQSFLVPLKTGKGRIVNISSRFGSLSFNRELENRELKISYSYRISKAAQNMLAVCLANELEGEGVRVSMLHPGSFRSNCGRPDARLMPAEVARTIHDWIISGKDTDAVVLKEIGTRDYGW